MDGFPEMESLLWQDVSYAVCRTENRIVQLMIPAKVYCPSDWILEYSGYLMAEGSSSVHHKSFFVCVDKHHWPNRTAQGLHRRVAPSSIWLRRVFRHWAVYPAIRSRSDMTFRVLFVVNKCTLPCTLGYILLMYLIVTFDCHIFR